MSSRSWKCTAADRAEGDAPSAGGAGSSQPRQSCYIDRARVLVSLAARASTAQTRSELMLLAALYQELAQRRVGPAVDGSTSRQGWRDRRSLNR